MCAGVRFLLTHQRFAINREKAFDAEQWIWHAKVKEPETSRYQPDDPVVLVAQQQIAKDGMVIIENVTRAVEEWRARQAAQEDCDNGQ